jgi:uncharacterized membrane protein
MHELVIAAPLVFGVLLLVTGVLGVMGRLPKNDWVGLRLHEVMRDEQTWRAGHRAGGPWLVAGGLICTVGGSAIVAAEAPADLPGSVAAPFLVVAVAAYTVASWRALVVVRRRGHD